MLTFRHCWIKCQLISKVQSKVKHFQRVINSIAPVSGLLANKEDEVRSTLLNASFYDQHKNAINMALERMEVNSRFRALN